MTRVTAKCVDCGRDIGAVLPDSEGTIGHRWAAAVVKVQPRCDECLACLEANERDKALQRVLLERRSRCGLPANLRGEQLVALPAKRGQLAAIRAARQWAIGEGSPGLMLLGPTGVGKTQIAAAACWTRLTVSPCTYASAARVMAQLGASFGDDARTRATRVFSGSGALVLDDLDKVRPTDFGREQLFAAVDAREQAGSPLLVTTNLTPAQIGERYGDALMSRLVGYCRAVKVEGEDWRIAK